MKHLSTNWGTEEASGRQREEVATTPPRKPRPGWVQRTAVSKGGKDTTGKRGRKTDILKTASRGEGREREKKKKVERSKKKKKQNHTHKKQQQGA